VAPKGIGQSYNNCGDQHSQSNPADDVQEIVLLSHKCRHDNDHAPEEHYVLESGQGSNPVNCNDC